METGRRNLLGGGGEGKRPKDIRGSNLARRDTLGARREGACLLTLQGLFGKGRWPACSIPVLNIFLLLFCLFVFCFKVTSAQPLSLGAETLTFAILDFFSPFCSDSGRAAGSLFFVFYIVIFIALQRREAFPGALRLSWGPGGGLL